jgi:hypothetical protein
MQRYSIKRSWHFSSSMALAKRELITGSVLVATLGKEQFLTVRIYDYSFL